MVYTLIYEGCSIVLLFEENICAWLEWARRFFIYSVRNNNETDAVDFSCRNG